MVLLNQEKKGLDKTLNISFSSDLETTRIVRFFSYIKENYGREGATPLHIWEILWHMLNTRRTQMLSPLMVLSHS